MTAQPASIGAQTQPAIVDIRPLLQRMWPDPDKENVTAQEIADAISLIFPHHLSPVQTGSLLTCLHFTGWDRRADVLAATSSAMRSAAAEVEMVALSDVVARKGRPEGRYLGGLVRLSDPSRPRPPD
jgi:anthranilate phosphoribosyltransferase